MTRETEEERQRQPKKVLHMSASVNITARCKKQAQKITDEAFGGAAAPYRPPLGYATGTTAYITMLWLYAARQTTTAAYNLEPPLS